jgi:aminoglycoside phosphotransferase (APT) family kinase protein
VLRRPPLANVLPTAHDMVREYKVIAALHPTGFPVPEPLHLCQDTDVLGAPFYLMSYVDGVVLRGPEEISKLSRDAAGRCSALLVDTLAALHATSPASIGLGDFGRPEGYLERQLRRWSRQLESSRNRDLPGVEELHSRLVAGMPAGAEGVVLHGDYRLDNVILGAHDEVAAVLDWEMSTLGDPLADVALLVAYRDRRTPSDDDPVGDATQAPGFPSAQDLVARYAERSGRDVSGLAWYVAFSYFKLAVILEGIHYRFIHGQTVGAGFDLVGEMVPGLVAAGLDWLRTERGEEREVR